jgi:Kef-type K+ transport system membrane component KefB
VLKYLLSDGGLSIESLFFLELAVLLAVAKLFGHFAIRLGQPSVLGELGAGMVLGVGVAWALPSDLLESMIEASGEVGSHLSILAETGVVLLLFRVGLESDLGKLFAVGPVALLVALTGVIVPTLLGFWVCHFWASDSPQGVPPTYMHIFTALTLSATSVGITARVFEDLGQVNKREARIVLGAAVADDVLGLMMLAVISSLILANRAGAAQSFPLVLLGTGTRVLIFFALAIALGVGIGPRLFRLASRLRGDGMLVITALVFCFFFAFLSKALGLASVVGAFMAGLFIDKRYFKQADESARLPMNPVMLDARLSSLFYFLIPLFFVLMGMQVNFGDFRDLSTLLYATALIAAAVVGKLVCGLWASGGWRSKLTVGVGMIPRGEVGLIFVGLGRTMGVVGDKTFSAVVLMVFVTTLMTPILLRLCIGTNGRGGDASSGLQSA